MFILRTHKMVHNIIKKNYCIGRKRPPKNMMGVEKTTIPLHGTLSQSDMFLQAWITLCSPVRSLQHPLGSLKKPSHCLLLSKHTSLTLIPKCSTLLSITLSITVGSNSPLYIKSQGYLLTVMGIVLKCQSFHTQQVSRIFGFLTQKTS